MTYSKYPQNIDDLSTLPIAIDNLTPVKAEIVNRLRDAIIAAESELGQKPSGTYGTVRARLDALEILIGETGGGGGGGGGSGGGHIISWGSIHLTSSSASVTSGFNVGTVTRLSEGLVDVEFTVPASRAYAVIPTTDFDVGSITVINKTSSGFTIQRSDINAFSYDDDFSFAVLSESVAPPLPDPQPNPNLIAAWANIHLTSSAATLTSGFNIASVTRTTTGTVRLTFTHPVSSAYSATGSPNVTGGEVSILSKTSANFTIQRSNSAGSATDADFSILVTSEGVVVPYVHPSSTAYAWGYITLTGSSATLSSGYNVASVLRTDVGTIQITLASAPVSNPYVVTGTPSQIAGSIVEVGQSGNVFTIERGNSSGLAIDANFNFIVYSNG